jgi:phosphatidylserine decarboxylase
MSPINVHVTRYAISGIVKFSKYHPGKYGIRKLVENERTTIVMKHTFGSILYRQVAGALAVES